MNISEKENIVLRLEQISRSLSGAFSGNFVEVEHANLKFKIFIYPSFGYPKLRHNYGFGASPRLEIILEIKGIPQFSVRREGIADIIGKALKLEKEIQIDDPKFDKSFFITVSNEAWGERFFRLSDIRLEISKILNLGFDYLSSENNNLTLNKYLQSLDDCPDALLKAAVSGMVDFASAYFKSF